MSYKLGLILSMTFVLAFLFLGVDAIGIGNAYNTLDSISISIGYQIAKTARVDTPYLTSLEERYDVKFVQVSPAAPALGDVVDFVISCEYNPFVISKSVITIKASRTTVLGYYG